MKFFTWTLSVTLIASTTFADSRGLSENSKASNTALLVSAANGLPGLHYDIDNLEEMANHEASGFSVEKLENGKGTVSRISENLTLLTDSSDPEATHLFYFTGHGGRGTILAEDRSMKFDEIKKALLKGREQWGPMARLTFMLDSCYSGTMIDPLSTVKPMEFLNSPQVVAQEMVDALVEELAPKRNESPLYKSLFAFVSAQSNETCLAGSKGSAFTVALKNAWNKALTENYTVEKFIAETQKGTKGSHPTARLVPAELAKEFLVQ
jgi:hypothetical protein